MPPSPWNPFAALDLWARSWSAWAGGPAGPERTPLPWSSACGLALETPSFRLWRFGEGARSPPLLLCTPFALHGAQIADLAPGHSLVEALLAGGAGTLTVLEWRSARPDQSHRSIDDQLADLSLAVDDLGGVADLVGLCQGGWLALMLAARHPAKVRRLVLAGAPVDWAAEPSVLTALPSPPILPGDLFRHSPWGVGIVPGDLLAAAWRAVAGTPSAEEALEDAAPSDALRARFQAWDAWTLDLPAPYFEAVAGQLFAGNALALGTFVARGRRIDLRAVEAPLYLLAGDRDRTVPPGQALAAARLVGTPAPAIRTALAPCDHLALFMGARRLRSEWAEIAGWLSDKDAAPRRGRRASGRLASGSEPR